MTQPGWLATAVFLAILAILIALPELDLVSDEEGREDFDDHTSAAFFGSAPGSGWRCSPDAPEPEFSVAAVPVGTVLDQLILILSSEESSGLSLWRRLELQQTSSATR